MLFEYCTRTFDTVLTNTDELMRYHYTDFFNSDRKKSIVEKDDSGIEYIESINHMVVEGELYKDWICDIVRELYLVKDCTCISVNGYDIDTSRYSPDEIILFIWIMQDNIEDDFCVEFIFGDLYKTPRYKCKSFMVYC